MFYCFGFIQMTINQIHQKLLNKQISALELAQDYLSRIKKINPELNAFITVTEKEAIEQAKNADNIIAQGQELPILAGIPASIKDVIMTKGVKTTAGSKILENYIAPYDATAVKKLKEQGLVMLGKNNCDEFAMGSSGENSAYGAIKNPYDKERVPGGSSGGSAAAVAADLSVYSLGSDTGGSIRQPAAFCGVVGLKPTYGAVSRFGLIAMASSFDQIGVIGKSVEDVEIVFNVIKGKDELDATSVEIRSGIKSESPLRFENQKSEILNKFKIQNSKFKNLRIGVPKEYFVKGMNKEVESVVKNVIKKAEELGAEVAEVSLPHTEYALAVYYIIMPSEVSANLARYDGIRYGESVISHQTSGVGLIDVYKKTRAKFLGDEVKRRIMLGTYTLSAGYYEAYYKKAQQVRTLIRQDFERVFNQGKVDMLITPTTPTPAFKLGEKTADPLTMYLEDVFTVPINVAGVPALSIPAGKSKDGLPIGVQLVGKWFEEEVLFRVGDVLEKVFSSTHF